MARGTYSALTYGVGGRVDDGHKCSIPLALSVYRYMWPAASLVDRSAAALKERWAKRGGDVEITELSQSGPRYQA